MFFFLSKFAYFFISPLNWLLALLVWRYFAKSNRIKRRINVSIIALVLFFGNDFIYTTTILSWQPDQIEIPEHTAYSGGIVLGGLSAFDRKGKGYLNTASDRLTETCILYKTGKIKKIIISGGAVYNDRPPEAPFLFQKLLELGVPAGDIIVEAHSRNTFENAAFTKKIVDSMHLAGPFVLVTSAMHLPRAERVFRKAGLPVIGFPSDFRVISRKYSFSDYFIPKLYLIGAWSDILKEIIGLWGYKLFNKA
jgi:uncharacterized SAM-binding protein YcdF (DUF218 family)